jgi:AmmeMemoRadiSam system protein B/AmmeMemoRadiSam system protein A
MILFLGGCAEREIVSGGSILLSTNQNNMINQSVKLAQVAGQFYPADSGELRQLIDNYLQSATVQRLAPPQAIIVPHAGLEYSGATAARAFKQLVGWQYDRVVLIGPSHHQYFNGAAVLDDDYYQTPLGNVKIAALNKDLANEALFAVRPEVFDGEHSLEIELPFLQTALDDFELIPIIVGGDNSYEELQTIAQTVRRLLTENSLLVVSSDFLHYGPNYNYVPFIDNQAENIRQIDTRALSYILNHDGRGFYDYLHDSEATIDGLSVIPLATEIFADSLVVQLGYETSGNLLDDYTNSVSYAALAFYQESSLDFTGQEQEYLLTLARQALTAAVSGTSVPEISQEEVAKRLLVKQGVFVTLKKAGQLRGCIGYISPYENIAQAVINNAQSAALHDYRFSPVTAEELSAIQIEISILSVPELLVDHAALRPGIDGLVLQLGEKQATYLPQVGDLPDQAEFLGSLSLKAGFAEDAWQDSAAVWYTYQAFHFSE